MREAMVSLSDVGFRYGQRQLFRGLNFSVESGDVLFLLGENGSGKSTLLRIICGIYPPHTGSVSIKGRGISVYARRELARLVSFAGDEIPADFPLMVSDFVSLGRFPHRGFFGSLSITDQTIVEGAMEMMEVAHLRDRYLHELSAGEKQRVFLARAVARDGELIVLDEPAAHLDMRTTVLIFTILETLASQGRTVIVSSHDANITARFSKSVMILKGGVLVAHGPKEDVITREKIGEAFGVDVLVDVNPADGTPRITLLG